MLQWGPLWVLQICCPWLLLTRLVWLMSSWISNYPKYVCISTQSLSRSTHDCKCLFCINTIIRLILKYTSQLFHPFNICVYLSQILTEVAVRLCEMFDVIKVPIGFTSVRKEAEASGTAGGILNRMKESWNGTNMQTQSIKPGHIEDWCRYQIWLWCVHKSAPCCQLKPTKWCWAFSVYLGDQTLGWAGCYSYNMFIAGLYSVCTSSQEWILSVDRP